MENENGKKFEEEWTKTARNRERIKRENGNKLKY